MNTRNLIFAFLGGVTIGSAATYAAMRWITKKDPERAKTMLTPEDTKPSDDIFPNNETKSGTSDRPAMDKPSFDLTKVPQTDKTAYHALQQKPSLEELAKKYEDAKVVEEAADREHPTDEDDEEDSEDDEFNSYEDMLEAPDERFIEYMEYDGFGHAITRLNTNRRDQEILLVPTQYAGEIFALENLTYYAGDDVLCDATDTPIPDVEGLIGDALLYFGQCGFPEDTVYVRNCSRGFEYEITRTDGYFGAKVYGVTDEEMREVTKPRKKTGTKKKEE